MNDAQQQVRDFYEANPHPMTELTGFLDITSESGEVAKEYLKATGWGTKEFVITPEYIEELGDLYFALVAHCNVIGQDLDTMLAYALLKYQSRVDKHGHMGSNR